MGWNKRKVEGWLGTTAFKLFRWWLSRKTPVQAERIGEKIGRLGYKLIKRRRALTLQNLELAFPEMPPNEREALARRVFEHFGRTAADFMQAGNHTDEEILANTEVRGRENLENALARGKGALLVGGHFGNWERSAHWYQPAGYKIAVVARSPNDRAMTEMVLQQRESAGVEVLARGNAARLMLDRLKKNYLVALLFDQNSEEAFIPFFGKPTGTVLGPAVISIRSGAPMLPMACYRIGPNRYCLEFGEPLQPAEGYEGAEALMRSATVALERAIREHPEQYLWLHDRWKSARKRGLL